MIGGQRTSRIVLLGATSGLAVFGLVLGEGRFAIGPTTALVRLVPTAVAFVAGGPAAGVVAAGLGVLAAAVFLGGGVALVVALTHVLPGLVLGVVLARRLPLPLALVAVTLASVLGLVMLLWTYLPVETGVMPFLGRQVETHVADLERFPGRLGLPGDPAWVADSARLAAATLRLAGPGLVLVGMFLVALTNYVGARLVSRARGFRPFAEEAIPDHLVWLVIGGGVMVILPHEGMDRVGVNLLVGLVPLYAIQGLAVLRHFFQRIRIPRPLQGLSFGLFAVQPLLLVGAACLGLSDLWVDFRKIRQAATPA